LPTTLRLEHFTRVFTAEKLFSVKALKLDGAYSDRGKVYIRFGPPDSASFDLGEGQSGPEIKWYYFQGDETLSFKFVDEFLNGDFHFAISDISGEIAESLYNELPPRYRPPYGYRDLPMYASVYQFRGPDHKLLIEFWMALPDTFIRCGANHLSISISLLDNRYNLIRSERLDVLKDTLTVIEKSGKRFILVPYSITIPPLEGRILGSLEIADKRSVLRSTFKEYLSLKELWGAGLRLSSIKLNIKSPDGKCLERGDPIAVYSEGENLCVEYIIYNLKRNSRGIANYSVGYRIEQIDIAGGIYARGLKGTIRYILSSVSVSDYASGESTSEVTTFRIVNRLK